MNLTCANYRTPEADAAYWSNSQYKSILECPARYAAELRGEWTPDPSTALLVGSYVDIALLTPDDLPAFVEAQRKEICTAKGELRADFQRAEAMIERVRREPDFMSAIDGEHQVLLTWELAGVHWKGLADCIDAERSMLTDLKTCRDFESAWDAASRTRLPFYECWDYWRQMALYRLGYQARHGALPEWVFIAAVTKEKHPRCKVLSFGQGNREHERFKHEIEKVEQIMPQLIEEKAAILAGSTDLRHCGQCDYCADVLPCRIEEAESLKW